MGLYIFSKRCNFFMSWAELTYIWMETQSCRCRIGPSWPSMFCSASLTFSILVSLRPLVLFVVGKCQQLKTFLVCLQYQMINCDCSVTITLSWQWYWCNCDVGLHLIFQSFPDLKSKWQSANFYHPHLCMIMLISTTNDFGLSSKWFLIFSYITLTTMM